MAETKETVRDVARDVQSLRQEIEPYKNVFKWFVVVVLGGIVTGGISIFNKMSSLEVQVESVRTELAKGVGAINTEIAKQAGETRGELAKLTQRLETGSELTVKFQSKLDEALARVDGRPSLSAQSGRLPTTGSSGAPAPDTQQKGALIPRLALELTSEEVREIQRALPLKPPVGGPPRFTYGDEVPPSASAVVPQELWTKVSKLMGYRYLIDANGWAILADQANRVAAIIGPAHTI